MCLEDLSNSVGFIEKINLWRSPRASYHLVSLLAFSIWLPLPIAKCHEGFLYWTKAGCRVRGQYAKIRWEPNEVGLGRPTSTCSLIIVSGTFTEGQHFSNKNWSNLIAGCAVADYLLIFWRIHNTSKWKHTRLLQHCIPDDLKATPLEKTVELFSQCRHFVAIWLTFHWIPSSALKAKANFLLHGVGHATKAHIL